MQRGGKLLCTKDEIGRHVSGCRTLENGRMQLLQGHETRAALGSMSKIPISLEWIREGLDNKFRGLISLGNV